MVRRKLTQDTVFCDINIEHGPFLFFCMRYLEVNPPHCWPGSDAGRCVTILTRGLHEFLAGTEEGLNGPAVERVASPKSLLGVSQARISLPRALADIKWKQNSAGVKAACDSTLYVVQIINLLHTDHDTSSTSSLIKDFF